ncbi:hypothetical protein BT96DRAFT_292746 [Gymnopus androsaceus JB14]|uniref:EH domain-containing protein n=1 Tax=Gymnopus androsaceus JB14 TaxID=1447944 RepID=A0A6A4I7J5_9AGAR|nr:hypothetical protein BT96DRAFT_292746 [Gymnopus androsaceus JB14]
MVPSPFQPTQEEVSLANRILLKANAGRIKPEQLATANLNADSAVDIFLGTQLSPQTLSRIWSESDAGAKGYLSRNEVAVALRLIGWAQNGEEILNRSLLGTGMSLLWLIDLGNKVPFSEPNSGPRRLCSACSAEKRKRASASCKAPPSFSAIFLIFYEEYFDRGRFGPFQETTSKPSHSR